MRATERLHSPANTVTQRATIPFVGIDVPNWMLGIGGGIFLLIILMTVLGGGSGSGSGGGFTIIPSRS